MGIATWHRRYHAVIHLTDIYCLFHITASFAPLRPFPYLISYYSNMLFQWHRRFLKFLIVTQNEL